MLADTLLRRFLQQLQHTLIVAIAAAAAVVVVVTRRDTSQMRSTADSATAAIAAAANVTEKHSDAEKSSVRQSKGIRPRLEMAMAVATSISRKSCCSLPCSHHWMVVEQRENDDGDTDKAVGSKHDTGTGRRFPCSRKRRTIVYII